MTTLSFSQALLETEIDQALKLAQLIFEPLSGINDYANYKAHLWRKDPTYALENFILAKDADKSVCGLVRVVPRKVFRGNEVFNVAGISSVCLSTNHRGKGNSIGLMRYAIECCRERGFDFAFLFARRAADNYYTRFGFHGVSSYSEISVRCLNLQPDLRLECGQSDEKYIDIYASAYEQCYVDVFGRVERTDSYWKFLLQKFLSSPIKFETVYLNKEPIGYVIAEGFTVHELALLRPLDIKGLIGLLKDRLPQATAKDNIKLKIPPQHTLVAGLNGLDISLTLRECAFGGHMACILNGPSLIERRGIQSLQIKQNLADLKGKEKWGYIDTCNLLGIHTVTATDQLNWQRLPFQISIADQF